MRFNFKAQGFQTSAVESVVKVFAGQQKTERVRYRREIGGAISLLDDAESEGYRNAEIALTDKELLDNIKKIQTGNKIKLSSSLIKELGAVSLDVEMETGAGKTYVYIKTMFELYERYGWGKFIVVTPSIAVREGVKKSFEITREHFMELYNRKARVFAYNSANLHQLDDFSSGADLQVMIINIQAFNTALSESKNAEGRSGNEIARIIYSKRDEFGSRRPIDVIKANRPIIILDEPQKMGGAATQSALKNNFNPLFSINYSATHKNQHNLVYVLDALDAFQKKIVKKIEVKGFELSNLTGTWKYLYLAEIKLDGEKPPRARIEFEVKHKTGVKRETRLVYAGDNLYTLSGNLEQYKGITVAEIDPKKKRVVLSNGDALFTGCASGDVTETDIRRIQIRETIRSHFEKEEKLYENHIKCLSLFFIDEVAKYRRYDENGAEISGEYAKIFEEEYKNLLDNREVSRNEKYENYLKNIAPLKTHRGYFSIDKEGRAVNSAVKRGAEFSDDISAYDLILKNKERLLSFDEPARFIFSHSALREGWDNPNVFQICALKRSDNAGAKRQEVGRGLRLCVNKNGDRQDSDVLGEEAVHAINTLTVIASESYAQFAGDLQTKIREDLYERPLRATKDYFVGKVIEVNGEPHSITDNEANIIHAHYLAANKYIDYYDNVTAEYRAASINGNFAPLPAGLECLADGVHKLVRAVFEMTVVDSMIEDAHKTKIKENPLNDNFYKKEFQELWSAINKKYAYTVDFDSTELIEKVINELNSSLSVSKLQYTVTTGIQIGVEFDRTNTSTRAIESIGSASIRYDLLGKIAEGVALRRSSVAAILKGLRKDKLDLFAQNPEEFISKIITKTNEQKSAVVINHISYAPSAEEPYSADIFNISKESQEYKKAFKAKKAVQDFIFTDGISEDSVEKRFAEDLDCAEEVAVYAKLPRGPKGFYIPTPVGNYSPDWAIAFCKDAVKHIFFIAETKGTMDSLNLRPIERAKITCAEKLFGEMPAGKIKYRVAMKYQDLLNEIQML
jgi:type III restriction enzyme